MTGSPFRKPGLRRKTLRRGRASAMLTVPAKLGRPGGPRMRRKFFHDRRQFLRGASYSLALPFLPSLPGGLRAQERRTAAQPKRLVCVGSQLGFYKPEFFADGGSPRLAQPLDAAGLGADFTTVSGLDHKGPTGNGHELVYTLYIGPRCPRHFPRSIRRAGAGQGHALRVAAGCAAAKRSRRRRCHSRRPGSPCPSRCAPAFCTRRVFGAGSVALRKQTYLIESGKSPAGRAHRGGARP